MFIKFGKYRLVDASKVIHAHLVNNRICLTMSGGNQLVNYYENNQEAEQELEKLLLDLNWAVS